ncbi:hypothetical protein LPJ57_007891 [Coemansia sp. RSA 486]|nr:hypothetical protein LPJ57_007891 [Coemansia sp. RSA 486]
MISMVGTPTQQSGFATPTQETAFSPTQNKTHDISGLPAALAGIAAKRVTIEENAGTVVYEEGQHDPQSTAVNLAKIAEEDDEDDEEEEYDYTYADTEQVYGDISD